MRSAGHAQKKRKAVVRKESADTHELEMGRDESLEELSFVPSAVSGPVGWREFLRAKYMCDKKCNNEASSFTTFLPSWWETTGSRTRSNSVEAATT